MYNKKVMRRTISGKKADISNEGKNGVKIGAKMNCLTITRIVSELCPLFMRVPRGDRRNGDSPTQGIDTATVGATVGTTVGA